MITGSLTWNIQVSVKDEAELIKLNEHIKSTLKEMAGVDDADEMDCDLEDTGDEDE